MSDDNIDKARSGPTAIAMELYAEAEANKARSRYLADQIDGIEAKLAQVIRDVTKLTQLPSRPAQPSRPSQPSQPANLAAETRPVTPVPEVKEAAPSPDENHGRRTRDELISDNKKAATGLFNPIDGGVERAPVLGSRRPAAKLVSGASFNMSLNAEASLRLGGITDDEIDYLKSKVAAMGGWGYHYYNAGNCLGRASGQKFLIALRAITKERRALMPTHVRERRVVHAQFKEVAKRSGLLFGTAYTALTGHRLLGSIGSASVRASKGFDGSVYLPLDWPDF